MAYIVGYANPEEREKLSRAGYQVHEYTGQNLLATGVYLGEETTVAVVVDCEILDLLAPNFCQRCGALVEDIQTYYEGRSKITSYNCTVCKSVENHVLFPPVSEEE